MRRARVGTRGDDRLHLSTRVAGERVSYSTRRAALVADQLERLATQNAHQLAGQVSNLAFWIAQATAAIRTIDDYPARFRRLRPGRLGPGAWHESVRVLSPLQRRLRPRPVAARTAPSSARGRSRRGTGCRAPGRPSLPAAAPRRSPARRGGRSPCLRGDRRERRGPGLRSPASAGARKGCATIRSGPEREAATEMRGRGRHGVRSLGSVGAGRQLLSRVA